MGSWHETVSLRLHDCYYISGISCSEAKGLLAYWAHWKVHIQRQRVSLWSMITHPGSPKSTLHSFLKFIRKSTIRQTLVLFLRNHHLYWSYSLPSLCLAGSQLGMKWGLKLMLQEGCFMQGCTVLATSWTLPLSTWGWQTLSLPRCWLSGYLATHLVATT